MKRASVQAMVLGIAVLFATLGGGAPRFLCVGPEGHASLEATLCGTFDVGSASCDPGQLSVRRTPGHEAPCGLAEDRCDRCTDTDLQCRAVTSALRTPSAPGPALSPPLAMLPPRPHAESSGGTGIPCSSPDPPIPLDTRTSLLI
jgi:hypothetical protein